MKTVYSPLHALQDAEAEYIRGKKVPSFEMPRRAQLVSTGSTPSGWARSSNRKPLAKRRSYACTMRNLWPFSPPSRENWSAENGEIDAFPNAWPPPRSSRVKDETARAEIGRYCIDMSSPITRRHMDCRNLGRRHRFDRHANIANGEDGSAFALCRPPGHHAGRDYFGGYCFLNNAAIAAQGWLDKGLGKIAILDIDYHHGNGTQDIFYDRPDVLTISIHADPQVEYPYYNGYADETGKGAGAGFTRNIPLPWARTTVPTVPRSVTARDAIKTYGAEALVVSLGVDTFGGDPISRFQLVNADFTTIGRAIASLGVPTLFVMEGGYAVEDIGVNAVNVLSGFEAGRQRGE